MRYLSEDIRLLLEQKEIIELVLLDEEGMVLDAEGKAFEPEHLAALISPLQGYLQNICAGLPLQAVEEISVRTLGPRMRVVLQPFTVAGSSYLLIALFPVTTFYRQVTADIVRVLKDVTRKLAQPEGEPARVGQPKDGGGKPSP
jgi:hypothetical protein